MTQTIRTFRLPGATFLFALATVLLPGLAHAETPGPDTATTPEAYRVGPGDKLRIAVYKDPADSLESVQVRPDGKITMPLIGDVEASGRTPSELRDAVTGALKTYMNNPSVTVIVLEATASTAFVVGEVNKPGTVPILGNMTVLQALAVAGGLKDFADAKNIRILRKGVTGTQTIRFNYKDAIKGAGSNPYLKAGDTVVVPD
jgi:polysaccharide export outer membrane protein